MTRLSWLAAILCSVLATDDAQAEKPMGFVKGHSWGWTGGRGSYASPAAADSMRRLAETGADTVCIVYAANLPAFDDPKFTWGDANPRMVSDDEIRTAIGLARDNGLLVILKPTVNCADGTWRAWIRFHRDLTEAELQTGLTGVEDPWGEEPAFLKGRTHDREGWTVFWDRYQRFLLHYAKIASEEGAQAFCVGCEMSSTEEYAVEWRTAIAAVRTEFGGTLIYNVNHGREGRVPFWEDIDVMGISGYYPVVPPEGLAVEEAIKTTTSQEEIAIALVAAREELRSIHQRFKKPILFIEAGLTSVRGCSRYPWAHHDANPGSPIDQSEQANYYRAMFETFWDEPWFLGYAWWDWPARLYPAAEADRHRGFCVYGKQAEAVVREWYARARAIPGR